MTLAFDLVTLALGLVTLALGLVSLASDLVTLILNLMTLALDLVTLALDVRRVITLRLLPCVPVFTSLSGKVEHCQVKLLAGFHN